MAQQQTWQWSTRTTVVSTGSETLLYEVAKRSIDILLATALIIVLLPLLLLIALLIKLDSPGPVIFTQERVGARRQRAQPSAESGGKYKLVNDPRVTRIGRFLRKFSLDELPQLCNVLKGDMSLVGPRPVPTYEVAGYQARHHNRFAALPGITGWWQVKGRCRVSFEEMIRMDLDYIRDASLWLDLKILFLTVPAVLSKRGAE